MPRRVRLATLLAFILHGLLILTGQYRLSFDAYIHMFFADHYRLDWWSLWDPRWYTGFSINSYPPLVHQIMALLGHLIGIDAAFALLLWAALTAYPLAVYAFSRIFTGRTVAGYAALGGALLPSVYLAAHTFGQIPTIVATLVALFGLAVLAEFLRRGAALSGALAVALFAVMMAAHHATLLFVPWVVAGLVLHLLLNEKIAPRDLFLRLALMLGLGAIAGLLVIWPFWAWGHTQSMQVPIDHPSRHNFLSDSFAVTAFFLPVYGPLMVLIPFALWKILQRRYTGLSLAFLPLFILGLGGTTPLPQWLFGKGWEWLIYDRFALWASILLLPFFGLALILVRQGIRRSMVHYWITPVILLTIGTVSMIIGLLPRFIPFEPAPVDMRPIVAFLEDPQYSGWRYLTFGFGDQLAYLSTLTSATTLDGDYHTARSLPELRNSGIGQIDTAFWTVQGLRSLDPILKKSGGHGVRWGFVDLPAYIPVLRRNGWTYLTTLSNGIQVWQNPAAVAPPPPQPPAQDALAAFSWGVLPLLSLALAIVLSAMRWRPVAMQRVLSGLQQLAIGLLPLGLCFWYYLPMAETRVPGVYSTYTRALLFAGDALGLVAVGAWLLARRLGPALLRGAPARWLLALCLLASLSVAWSLDWRVSLYVSLHLWLVFGVFLCIQSQPGLWRAAAFGFCAALLVQVLLGIAQFAGQSTAFMAPLGLNWPGSLNPGMPGVSVVQLADGARWLRVYGSFPHPNILGGMLVAFLAGPLALFMAGSRRRIVLPLLVGLGAALLVLTFSRAAWLGLAVTALVLIFRRRVFEARRLWVLILSGLAGFVLAAAPLHELVFTRAGGAPAATETFSNVARVWLAEQAFGIIRQHPVLGVGIGGYILAYARIVPYGYLLEPVHDLPLLVLSELGLAGLAILGGLAYSVLRASLRTSGPLSLIFSAVLAGLAVTALLDHYLWTLAPGRLLIGLMLGLWAGQINQQAQTTT